MYYEDFLELLAEKEIDFMDFFDLYYEFRNLPEESRREIIEEYVKKNNGM